MAREAAVLEAERTTDERPPTAGNGACTVAGCGCGGWNPAGSQDYCQGRNSAGGTCGHRNSQHA